MTRLAVVVLIAIAEFASPVAAQERVLVGTQRLVENGALFLAAAQGYFKAEGIDLGMTAYESDRAVAETLAVGTTDFGLAGFTPVASSSALPACHSTPTRGIFLVGCCARAVCGHAAAAPPSKLMNSRRLIPAPRSGKYLIALNDHFDRG
jgi:ABC-type nitrate/sulfonate/bicarbonate transport system substrate-binding protein